MLPWSREDDQEEGGGGFWSLGDFSFPQCDRSAFWEVSPLLGVGPGEQGFPPPGLWQRQVHTVLGLQQAARPSFLDPGRGWDVCVHRGCLVFLCFPCGGRAGILSVTAG